MAAPLIAAVAGNTLRWGAGRLGSLFFGSTTRTLATAATADITLNDANGIESLALRAGEGLLNRIGVPTETIGQLRDTFNSLSSGQKLLGIAAIGLVATTLLSGGGMMNTLAIAGIAMATTTFMTENNTAEAAEVPIEPQPNGAQAPNPL